MKTLLSFSTLSVQLKDKAQRSAGEQVIRCFTLETLIPKLPRQKSIRELHTELVALGFDCDVKTIRRDIDLLSGFKPVICDEDTKPKRYSLSR